jgi:hypothetical protein
MVMEWDDYVTTGFGMVVNVMASANAIENESPLFEHPNDLLRRQRR